MLDAAAQQAQHSRGDSMELLSVGLLDFLGEGPRGAPGEGVHG